MNIFARAARAAVVFCAGLVALPAVSAGIQQAFLVQNSGWMEPFYSDPASQLKALVAAVAGAATSADDPVFTLAFSQSKGSNVSPALLASGRGTAAMGRDLAALTVARKGPGAALADTDFKEAISKTITGPFKAAPGIIWIFTNNKNSPDNDAQTAERNRDFYRLLHLEPSITKTLVFALKMPVQGKQFAARGLMVYALAYGKPAAEALDRIMAEGRLTRVLTQAPARLKPVDQDALRIVPVAVKDAPNVSASLGADQRTLVLDVEAAGLVPTVTLQAKLENLFYPYVIQRAGVEASLLGSAERTPVRVEPAVVQGLQPGAAQPVEVSFTLPMAQVPSAWSAQALAAMGKQVLLPMVVEMGLTGQQLTLSENFSAEMRELFPGDPISEVFTPPDSVRASLVRVPLLVRIQYPLLPVLALMGGLLLLVGGLVALGLASRSSKRYELVVDGNKRNVVLKPFASLAIKDGEGRLVGEIKRGLGRPQVLSVAEGHTLNLGRP
ncbi:hypothetical protein [Rhodoferax antarcticus]|nr:hypothetical protein [Rhodoferax antarcticus]APW47682.1 hypothetical protein RA876_16510 [Rhodoferax antarcticus]